MNEEEKNVVEQEETEEREEMSLIKFLDYAPRAMKLAFERKDFELYTSIMTYAREFDREKATYDLMQETAEELGEPELWELPKPFERKIRMQGFPVGALPKFLGDYMKAVADYVQVDVDMCALPLLSVLSMCVQGKYCVQFPLSNHKEPLNLYTLTVAKPGERKSGAFKAFTAPVFEYQKKENERRKPLIADYKALKKSKENEFEQATKGKNADEQRARQLALELESLKPVNRLTLNITDCTPEALVAEMSENNEIMSIMDDECGIFETLSGIYSGGISNIDIFLKAYDGAYTTVARRTKENIYLSRPLLTLGLMAQPEPFTKAMCKPEFVGRGLIHRFMFAFPESQQGARKHYTEPVSVELYKQYDALVEKLLSVNIPEKPQILMFNKNACRVMGDYFEMIEKRLAEPDGQLVYMAEWANKLYAKCCRIAGILHLCEHEPTEQINEDTAFRAIDIAMWAENNAHKAFSFSAVEDEKTKNAKYILTRLKEKKIELYTKHEFAKICKKLETYKLDEALDVLEDMNYVRVIIQKTKSKPKTIIKVSPLIMS